VQTPLCNNCIGSTNTAFGYAAAKEVSNSSGNMTAFGSRAAQRINGRNNTAFGFKALYGAAAPLQDITIQHLVLLL
jgi:hypothetical protein